MVEKRLLAAFIVTRSLDLVVVLDLFQLHVISVIPCLLFVTNRTITRRSSTGRLRLCRGL